MSTVYQTQFKAWSCDFSVEIIGARTSPDSIVAAITETLNLYERAFSRFVRTSDLSQLNNGYTVKNSPVIQQVLAEAVRLTNLIGQEYFNPHVNLASLGYNASIEHLNFNVKKSVTKHSLPFFPKGIRYGQGTLCLQPGITIDVGSFLKGLVSMEIAERYKNTCDGLIVNFGGDLTLRGRDRDTKPFAIGIINPITKENHWVELCNQSLCTSGTYKRTWKTLSGQAHHILDAKSNISSTSNFVSISFWGQDASLCDALATAAFNAPPTQWEQWRNVQPDLQYLAVAKDGKIVCSLDCL